MSKIQSVISLLKKPIFILSLILIVFFLKGFFLTTLFPIFTGQDEARHYNSIQYLNEPENKNWDIIDRKHLSDKENLNDYNFSEEIIKAGQAADFDIFRHNLFDTANFSLGSYNGKNEASINAMSWKPYNFYKPADTGGGGLYHTLGDKIEKALSTSNILVRFFSNRIFSVILGTFSIFLAYLIAKNIGFKEKESLILTTIISFQPKYAMYLSNINYDALLIPLFSLFTLGGILSLKYGLNWKNFLIMTIAVLAGLYTKGTAIVLLGMFAFLIIFHIYKKTKWQKQKMNMKIILLILILILAVVSFTNFDLGKFIPIQNGPGQTFNSLKSYLAESLTWGRLALSSRTYWGTLSWFPDLVNDNLVSVIWVLETISAIGVILFLLSRKTNYLPEKKYIIFLLAMIFALQLGIRIADWKIYDSSQSLLLGTPGRYFLSNLTAHIILLFVGLGYFLQKEKYFHYSLLAGMVLMFSFSMYLIFNIILPRYYL